MTINNSLNNLLARRSPSLMAFSAVVTTASSDLKCAAGETGQGVPVPGDGKAVSLQVWDGTALNEATGEVDLSAGDRLNLYAQNDTGSFTIILRINGIDSSLVVPGVSENATLTASLLIILE